MARLRWICAERTNKNHRAGRGQGNANFLNAYAKLTHCTKNKHSGHFCAVLTILKTEIFAKTL